MDARIYTLNRDDVHPSVECAFRWSTGRTRFACHERPEFGCISTFQRNGAMHARRSWLCRAHAERFAQRHHVALPERTPT